MKNKTKTYLLISIVLGIWGTIGYKILSAVSPDETEQSIVSVDASFQPKTSIQKDTFSIQLADRDPFLGTLTSTSKVSTRKQPVSNFNAEKEVQPIITYHGLIKRQNSSNQVFTISIDNQQYLLKKGQTISDVTLVRGNTKRVVMRYNGKLMTISIQ